MGEWNKEIISRGGDRNINIEILRIVSMIMIIIGHALRHSTVMDEATGVIYVVLKTIEIIVIPAVNVYVLISGYFLIDAKWNFKRILLLWLQVFFYSTSIYTIAIITGIAKLSVTDFLEAILPISGNQYWFARVFLCFSLFAPFVAMLLRILSKKQYQFLIVITLIIFCLWKSFLPFSTTVNPEGGNSILWFFVLFTIAGYIKLNMTGLHKNGFWIITLILSSLLTISSYWVLKYISIVLGFEGKGSSLFTTYTSITVLVMSISLFLIFITLKKVNYSQFFGKIILFVSKSTYSVYLVHDNKYIRCWLWSTFNPAKWLDNPLLFFGKFILIVVAIFFVGTMTDFISWKQISKLFRKLDFEFIQNKIDEYMK